MASVILPYTNEYKTSAIKAGLMIRFISPSTMEIYSHRSSDLRSWLFIHRINKPTKIHSMISHLQLISHTNQSIRPHTGVPYFNMNQVRDIYNIPIPSANNVVVGVLSFGGGLYGTVNAQGLLTNGDVQKYWTALGIMSQPKVIIVPILGAKNVPNMNDGGSTMENTLDVETIGGACPTSKLTIILYIAPNTMNSFPTLLNYIYTTNVSVGGVNYKPTIISCSWGAPEIYYPTSLLTNINSVLQKMNTANMNICVATGDNGSNDGVGGKGAYVDFPSSNPNVTAVGGTTLVCPNRIYDSSTQESGWSYGGGGVSAIYNKPSYQSIISGSKRSTPDIASLADPNTGVVFIVNGKTYVIGGTSVAAPIVAGYLASINCKTFINPLLYKAPSNAFHDILNGSNGAYVTKVGYDNCTGLGSINGAIFKPFKTKI